MSGRPSTGALRATPTSSDTLGASPPSQAGLPNTPSPRPPRGLRTRSARRPRVSLPDPAGLTLSLHLPLDSDVTTSEMASLTTPATRRPATLLPFLRAPPPHTHSLSGHTPGLEGLPKRKTVKRRLAFSSADAPAPFQVLRRRAVRGRRAGRHRRRARPVAPPGCPSLLLICLTPSRHLRPARAQLSHEALLTPRTAGSRLFSHPGCDMHHAAARSRS